MELYELTQEFTDLYHRLDDEEIDENVLNAELEVVAQQITSKTEEIGKLVKIWEAEAKKFEDETRRMQIRKKSLENKIERIKEYVKHHMEVIGTSKIEGELFKFAIQKNSRPKIETMDIDKLPNQYIIIEKRPDNDLLYQDWKMGKQLPAGVNAVVGTHLRIR